LPTKGDEVGPRIDFPGLTYAPINEQGVVLLFGMLADNIGFSVESIRVHYPDAIVIDYRAGKESRGVRKYVEFEYVSSNFEGHDPKECDMIVCWEDNWENRPKDLEVLELKSLLQQLKEQAKEQETIEEALTPHIKHKKVTKEKPDYMTSWVARLAWVEPETKELAQRLIARLVDEIPGISGRPRFRWYSMYRATPPVRRNDVATLLVGRENLKLSIRINPKSFSDPYGISKPMAGFFYPPGMERRMPVTSENLETVIKIAKSAYQGLADESGPKVEGKIKTSAQKIG
jgi:hypothetical protein